MEAEVFFISSFLRVGLGAIWWMQNDGTCQISVFGRFLSSQGSVFPGRRGSERGCAEGLQVEPSSPQDAGGDRGC